MFVVCVLVYLDLEIFLLGTASWDLLVVSLKNMFRVLEAQPLPSILGLCMSQD
jgi:hypothetical protein